MPLMSLPRRFPRTAAGVFLLALVVRLLYLWDSHDNPTFLVPVLDSMSYDLSARGLVGGEGLGVIFFWQPFFYPAFLSAMYWIGGSSIVFAKIAQAVLGAVTCLLTWRLGQKLFGRGVGLAAGIIVAFFGPLVFFEGELLASGWAAFWSVALVLIFLRTAERMTVPYYFLLGLCGALSTLTRPTFIPFLAAGCVWLGIAVWRSSRRWILLVRGAAAAAAGFLLLVTPVAIANLQSTGHFGFLPASGGINFYIGNNPDYEETVTARPGSEWSHVMDLPQRRGVYEPDMWVRQGVYLDEVADYIRSEPASFVAGVGEKSLQVVSSREIPRNVDLYDFRKWSFVLSVLARKIGPFGFPMGLILPFAVVGIVFGLRRIPGVLLWGLGLYCVSIALVFVSARYRVAMAPLILCLAAAGGGLVVQMILQRRWGRLSLASVCMVATVLLATLPGPFAAERIDYGPEISYGVGRSLARRGRVAEATEHLRATIRLNPGSGDAHANLAYMLETLGRRDEALEHYEEALALNPKVVRAYEGAGRLLAAQGKYEEAIAHYRRGLELRPHHVSMRSNLAECLIAQGRNGEGMREFERALQYDPTHAPSLYQLGIQYLQKEEYSKAVDLFWKAIYSLRAGPVPISIGDVYYSLARATRGQGDDDKALEYYKQADREYRRELQANPGNPNLIRNLQNVYSERKRLYGE